LRWNRFSEFGLRSIGISVAVPPASNQPTFFRVRNNHHHQHCEA
jgi:hypothetical protein